VSSVASSGSRDGEGPARDCVSRLVLHQRCKTSHLEPFVRELSLENFLTKDTRGQYEVEEIEQESIVRVNRLSLADCHADDFLGNLFDMRYSLEPSLDWERKHEHISIPWDVSLTQLVVLSMDQVTVLLDHLGSRVHEVNSYWGRRTLTHAPARCHSRAWAR